ncbi:MAG TPA: hypothetical protein VN634_20600 [Candidatus Limnocylindrales bacterium]|nr:hypothetical protein [Candidatus Limnocylindrales bacterium]
MKKSIFSVFVTMVVFAIPAAAVAGGKPAGASCHVHKSCRSNLCVRLQPSDKFGVCCSPQDCAELGAQCGFIDNGCGTDIQCGDCSPGDQCVNNQCVAGTTTTTTTSTTTSTSSTTSTTSSTTSTTIAGACPSGGQLVGGFCWYLSAAGASCDATCSGVGLVYNDATRTYAGSDGASFADCNSVLEALGTEGTQYGDGTCLDGIGCFWQSFGIGRVRCTSPTTTGSAYDTEGTALRACACD